MKLITALGNKQIKSIVRKIVKILKTIDNKAKFVKY